MQNPSPFFAILFASFGLSLCCAPLSVRAATIPTPIWIDDPKITFQSYTFTTDSDEPDPEIRENAFGFPEMSITNIRTPGDVGIGYLDPDDPFQPTRDGGAWDLGPQGFIVVNLPVAFPLPPLPGYFYEVDVFISIVYLSGLYSAPYVYLTPSTPVVTSDSFFFQEGQTQNIWHVRTAEATLEMTSNEVTILLDAAGPYGSLIDTIEIHTRYTLIPEPRVYALLTGLVVLGVVLFNSRKRQAALP